MASNKLFEHPRAELATLWDATVKNGRAKGTRPYDRLAGRGTAAINVIPSYSEAPAGAAEETDDILWACESRRE